MEMNRLFLFKSAAREREREKEREREREVGVHLVQGRVRDVSDDTRNRQKMALADDARL